jgi:hypothetical protein
MFAPRMRREFEAGGGPRHLLRYNVVTGAAAAFRADLRDILLPIPADWVHDGWIGFLAAATTAVRPLPDPLVLYRQHAGQQIGAPPLTLWRQVQTARRVDAAYFAKFARCYEALAERLEAIRGRLRDPGLVGAARARAALDRVRQRMREGPRLARVRPAAREWLNGNYARFAQGYKAFAADVLL